MNIRRGEKVALVGENGTGKSTLLKAIFGGGSHSIDLGRFVKLAYYDQEGANLNAENTVIAELWERHTGLTQTEVRSALARCGLFEEDMQKPVKALSGGERAKLALCVLESERGNVLLLDEPTNHLDLIARESLEKALAKFDGTLIFVSHDRYFLDALAQKVVEISNFSLNTYDCGYAEYTQRKRIESDKKLREEEAQKLADREEQRQCGFRSKKERAAEAQKKLRIKKLEEDISALESEENQLNEMLTVPEIVCDYKKTSEISERLAAIKLQLDALYNEYESMIE